MEKVIDFLLGNAFFAIILIGIVSSFFKKLKMQSQGNTPHKPKRWADRFGGTAARQFSGQHSDQFNEKLDKSIERAGMDSPVYHDSKLELSIDKVREETRIERKLEVARTMRNIKNAKAHNQEGNLSASNELTFGKHQIINGLIMAEIIGKPRALNRHNGFRK